MRLWVFVKKVYMLMELFNKHVYIVRIQESIMYEEFNLASSYSMVLIPASQFCVRSDSSLGLILILTSLGIRTDSHSV